jgi:two-component system response regulator VicR
MDKQKLLLVEDDETIALGLSYALEKQFDVKVCRNVMTALEEIKGIEYDIALIDITLPDGAGYEVCKAIKEKWNTGIIFLTARQDVCKL